MKIEYIPRDEFVRVETDLPHGQALPLLAAMARFNTFSMVKRAGSGHLGSSLSCLDIVTWLYYRVMNTRAVGWDSPDRDIFFSSKGHDVPGLYAILYALGILPEEKAFQLRRLEGTCGHPDVSIPGIEANSGSLGMGIAKGRGMAWAIRERGSAGRVFVMTGDGELQEGQIYESLLATANQGASNLYVIVDHNKVQSDKPVATISDLGEIEAKFAAFGWAVIRCDGHDFAALDAALTQLESDPRPKAILADTIKGKGISFMEHPAALAAGDGLYRWHSGAPDDESFAAGTRELAEMVESLCTAANATPIGIKKLAEIEKKASGVTREYVANAYGECLLELAKTHPELVVIDADLADDCRVRAFENTYPERFIENGIAEQDMVSLAGGLALQGKVPVVNSFAAFLASRSNEQIYANACEETKVIYACHYAGVIPAGPGQTHQSLRDISLAGATPGMTILQPANPAETCAALTYCVEKAEGPCLLRLIIGPSPRAIELPAEYALTPGRGAVLTDGADGILFSYGPVMLHEALTAAEILQQKGFGLKIVNMPWLNRVDTAWLDEIMTGDIPVFVLEDHAPFGGLADTLGRTILADNTIRCARMQVFAIDGLPAWGTPSEVLAYHKVDGASIAARIAGNGQ